MSLNTLALRKFVFQSAPGTYWEIKMNLNDGTAECRKLGAFLKSRHDPNDEIVTVDFSIPNAVKFRNDCLGARAIWGPAKNQSLSSILTT